MASVRAATEQDAGTCAAIVADLPDFFTDDVPEKVRSDLRDHGGWVIDDAGVVVGFVTVQRRGTRAAEIMWAAVAADRRGAGLGTRLVNHVLDELSADGVQIVEVKTLDPSADYAPYERRGPSGSLAGSFSSTPSIRFPLAAGEPGGDPRRRTRPDAVTRSPSPIDPSICRRSRGARPGECRLRGLHE